MTDKQRSAWRNAAANYQVRNRAGQNITLNGWQLYIRWEMALARALLASTPDVPENVSVSALSAAPYWGTAPGYRMFVWIPPLAPAAGHYVTWSVGRSYTISQTASVIQWCAFETYWLAGDAGEWRDVIDQIILRLGAPANGEMVGTRFTVMAVGRLPSREWVLTKQAEPN